MGRLGSDPTAPMLQSRRSPLEKEPWKSLPSLEGQVEAEFLRPALLGESILPYRFLESYEAVIPIDSAGTILDSKRAENSHLLKLADWLAKAEQVWSDNAASDKLTLSKRWNYQRGLTNQIPVSGLRIVYAASGSQPAACLIRDRSALVEHKLYWNSPSSEEEAYYLLTLLNSEVTRSRAEQYQSRGQFGARDFDKVIWNLPIPVFNPKSKLHKALANAGTRAEEAANLVDLIEGEKFQRARKRVRDTLIENGIAAEIDKLVEKLLAGEAGD